jgi:hypothetical protein
VVKAFQAGRWIGTKSVVSTKFSTIKSKGNPRNPKRTPGS